MSLQAPVLKVKLIRPGAKMPRRATQGSTGLDLFACLDKDDAIALGTMPRMVPTGIAIEVPRGYDVQLRPRSGLSARGVGVTFGTVDSDYRGEVMVTMYLFDRRASFEVRDGDRIAQMVISTVAQVEVVQVAELEMTERGHGGHGSTGR